MEFLWKFIYTFDFVAEFFLDLIFTKNHHKREFAQVFSTFCLEPRTCKLELW